LIPPRSGAGQDAAPATQRPKQKLADQDLTAKDRLARGLFLLAALVPAGMLIFLAAEMIDQSIPAFIYSGLSFFTGQVFSFGNLYATTFSHHHGYTAPHGAVYGALPLIFGTLASSLLALLIAVPVSVGAVLALTERIPYRLQSGLSVFLEILAGIPSVAYGVWGVLFLGPFLAVHVYPTLSHVLGFIPLFKGPVGYGPGLLTTAVVLAVMIVPIIAATTRELVRTVPVLAKEGALALGMTRYEAVRVVTLPYVRRGIVAAAVLGWARALGETMAVLLISGNLLGRLPENIYGPFSTIAATIVDLLDSALTDSTRMGIHALAALGCVLLFITLITNLAGRLIIRRATGNMVLPVGRGI
jgi:phosphate transport system permease protein